MATSTNLVAVGCEAFALLEECLKRKPRPPPLHQSHHHHLQYDQLPSVTTTVFHTKEAIDSYQAVLMYGGVSVVDYRNRKPPPSFRKV